MAFSDLLEIRRVDSSLYSLLLSDIFRASFPPITALHCITLHLHDIGGIDDSLLRTESPGRQGISKILAKSLGREA